MYKLFVLLAFVLPSFLMSQIDYGNEWIDYNRQYYHFSVLNSGIHKISYEVMNNAGIPVNSISPNEFQVFGREKEVAIRVIDGGDSSFDPGDYIEFIAERNEGWLDSVLFIEPEHIGNPAYSLYNDTLFYYLTWSPGNNKRYTIESDFNFNNYTPTPFVFQKRTVNFNNQYYGGFSQFNSFSSFFVAGEGWGSPNYNGASGFALPISVNTSNPYTGSGAPPVTFHGKSMANSNANFTGQGNHHLRWEVGSSNTLLYDEIFVGYRQTVVDETFPVGLLNDGNSTITFRIVGDQGATTDFQSVQYLELEYPRTLNMNNANSASFRVGNSANEAKIRLDITNSNLTNPICYVRGGGVDRFIPMVENSGVWQALIPNSQNGQLQQVSIFSENSLINVNQLTSINGNGFFTDFSSLNFEEAFLMIYPNVLSSSANQYAAYRSSGAGGAYNTLPINAEELYHQFGGGIPKHALAIKRFSNFAFNMSTEKPKALLLLGKGIREATEPNTSTGVGTRKSFNSYTNSLLPSFGYPSSDICFTNRFNNDANWVPNIPVGRIAARNNTELLAYLNKLQIYEANQNQNDIYNKPNKEWQKRVLHFGGGDNTNEQNTFQAYLNSYKQTIKGA